MAESNDVQTLEKISTEADESRFKIILSSHCIKAQAFLVDKLRKQSEQQRQICYFISNGNSKLASEIKIAEQEVRNILNALETIKVANVELKKELLIVKDRKIVVNERINNGLKKYEELWVTTKRRYENIPFIQNYLQIKNRNNALHETVMNLNDEIYKINNDVNLRKIELLKLDRKHVIELAKFMVIERPKILKSIQETSNEIKEISDNIDELIKEREKSKNILKDNIYIHCAEECGNEPMEVQTKNSWPYLSTADNSTIMFPKLQLGNVDLDSLANKLDQVKKVDLKINSKINNSENIVTIENMTKRNIESDELINDLYISSYFQNSKNRSGDEVSNPKRKKYSENKLINILEEIKLNKLDTFNIVANLRPSSLQDVNVITARVSQVETNKVSQEKASKPVSNEVIEEIKVTKQQSPNILIPPTQFLDYTQELANTQNQKEEEDKPFRNISQEKKVVFDEIVSVRSSGTIAEKQTKDEMVISDSPDNQLNVSVKSDDSYAKIKEIVFKKHNLNVSPQFSYTKNKSNIMISNSNIVKSKFFLDKNNDYIHDETLQIIEIDDNVNAQIQNTQQREEPKQIDISDNSNPNINVQDNDGHQSDKPVAGFLFTHGPKGIPESLNVSMNTTGFDEEDADYPQCFDSNLLLSPKADVELPSTSTSTVNVLSQEVPNFLSGIKKTGFSFFGNKIDNETEKNVKVQNNNFSFSFGSDNKKNRGDLFNMFR